MPPPIRKKRATTAKSGPAAKRIRAPSAALSSTAPATTARAAAPQPVATTSTATTDSAPQQGASLRDRFLKIFENPDYRTNGISNTILKQLFSAKEYLVLPGTVINQLTKENRLRLCNDSATGELFYQYVDADVAEKLRGLDGNAVVIYQAIEKADNKGIWTRDIKFQTKIQGTALTKILKTLEGRHLIKPVKSVTAKTKKLYMLYHLTPSTELTGGVWYSDLDFDHEFISELRMFLLKEIREINKGKGATANQLLHAVKDKKVSKVDLSLNNVTQLLKTLEFDYKVEKFTEDEQTLYVLMRRVTGMSEFKWWDALDADFKYRTIRFEDGVELAPHEPHHQTD